MTSFLRFFDKMEDKTRTVLSKYPIVYAFVGGVSIVLFWRAVWLIADETYFLSDPYMSLIVSVVLLLSTGLFISFFIGDSIIISGIKGEKKIIEKTELDIKKEGSSLSDIKSDIDEEGMILRDIQNELRELRTLVEDIKRK